MLFFGWDWESKGGPLVLDALAELRSRGRDVRALMVGSPEKARDRALALGISDAVQTSGGRADARALFAAADVFISAGVAEGLPFSVLEALSCGLPVIASDIPSHRFLADRVPGCTVVPRRAGRVHRSDRVTLDRDAADRAALASASRHAVERDFSLERWSERLIALYRELLLTARSCWSLDDPPRASPR